MRDELAQVRLQARIDQAQLICNTDQCLGESLAQANKESEQIEARMTREIERLLNDHDNTYAHTMTSLEEKLDETKLRIEEQRAAKGSPVKAWLDETGPTGGRYYSGDKVANCATSQFGARSDYGLPGHNDVCLDVRTSE